MLANTLTDLQPIIDSNDRVVVSFGAPSWCVPCQRLAPHFEKAAEQLDFPLVEVDIDKADEALREKYTIMSVPTVLLFKKGIASEVRGRTVVQIVNEVKNA